MRQCIQYVNELKRKTNSIYSPDKTRRSKHLLGCLQNAFFLELLPLTRCLFINYFVFRRQQAEFFFSTKEKKATIKNKQTIILPASQQSFDSSCFVRALTMHIFGKISHRIIFSHTSDLLIIICSGQGLQSVWIKFTTGRIKLLPVILGQFGSEGINGDDKCPPICLKGQNLAHDFLKY